MKLGFIALPLVFVSTFSLADEANIQPTDVPDEVKPASVQKIAKHRMKRMPETDRRACLELKSNPEIIRCAERRKK